jgi:PIN domain
MRGEAWLAATPLKKAKHMLRLLVDTCVWLDMAKDYCHQPTLAALAQLIEANEVSLVLPRQAADEFARNKNRIIKECGQSLSSTFKRVKEAVKQFGKAKGRKATLASLDDVDHRITILGEAVNGSIQRIEKMFAAGDRNERRRETSGGPARRREACPLSSGQEQHGRYHPDRNLPRRDRGKWRGGPLGVRDPQQARFFEHGR